MNFQKRGRDRISIVAQILNVALEGSLKTQIMYRANLSFRQLYSYLSLLQDWKLLEKAETNGKTVFKTTPKGVEFLQHYRGIEDLLRTESVKEAIELKVTKQ